MYLPKSELAKPTQQRRQEAYTDVHRRHQDPCAREELLVDLDEIARRGARRMLAQALEAEVEAYLEATRGERAERGHALVVRNGYAKEREVLLGAGAIEVHSPRVNDRRVDEITGQPKGLKSMILPPYMRRSPKISEVLPLLYLHGLSSGHAVPTGGVLWHRGRSSSPTITPLTHSWQAEWESFMSRNLSGRDCMYVRGDGIHTGVKLGRDKRLCYLVTVGDRLDGAKELVALHDGYRESAEHWAELLRDLKRRGMRPPVVAVGDGVLDSSATVRDVFSGTLWQRDWVHKTSTVLDALRSPSTGEPRVISTRSPVPKKVEAERAIGAFACELDAKWSKAVAKITDIEEVVDRL